MFRYFSLLTIISIVFLAGAGCVKNTNYNEPNLVVSDPETSPEENENFCLKKQQEAESKIENFKMTEEQKKFFEVWKRALMFSTKIDEKTFQEQFFVFEAKDIKETCLTNSQGSVGYAFSYFLKRKDMYLDSSRKQVFKNYIFVKSSELEHFNKETPESIIARLPEDLLTRFDDNLGGKGFNAYHYYFSWGEIFLDDYFTRLPSDILSCQEAVSLLKTCNSFLKPLYLTYHPGTKSELLLSGSHCEEYLSSGVIDDKNVGSGVIDLVGKKIKECSFFDGCYLDFGEI